MAKPPETTHPTFRVWSMSGEELAAWSSEETQDWDILTVKQRLRASHSYPVCMQQILCLRDNSILKDTLRLEGFPDLQLVLKKLPKPPPGRASNQQQVADEIVNYAARSGDLAVLKMMLEAGADKDLPDEEGATALIMSSQEGHKEIVRLLLVHRADLTSTDDCERTALMHAAAAGHSDISLWLLQAKADTNMTDEDDVTALMFAASRGENDILCDLLIAKAGMEFVDKNGETALCSAARKGHTTAVECLLVSRANVDHRDVKGFTALQRAAQSGYHEIVQLLLVAGADKEIVVTESVSEALQVEQTRHST
ncbi:unnamed protein product [Symbiodinium sp. CCMP2592]|nr:unnamed protein product [Symbiodinium sp. CCMP2592]